jgi:dethiobiotin synthetase
MHAVEVACSEGLFITGTDTGVGKTLVGAALVYLLTAKGCRVGVAKPLESGVADTSRLGQDGELLRWASGSDAPLDGICPYRLDEPLAPALAAHRQGICIEWPRVLDTLRQSRAQYDFTVAEGAGGLLVPLAGKRLVADLVADIGWPLLVVARPGLGTVNHTLLTLETAKARGLNVVGWIINGLPCQADVAQAHAVQQISGLTDIPCWGVLSQVEGSDREKVVKLARQMEGWDMVRSIRQGSRSEVNG